MKRNVKRFCHVGSIFSLLVYIVYSTDDEIKSTFYLFDRMISCDFAKKFENSYRFCRHAFFPRKWYFAWFDLKMQKLLFCPKISRDSVLFANDHLWSSAAIIGRHSYVLLEDGALICTNYWLGAQRKEMELNRKTKSYVLRKFLFGPVESRPNGDNDCCTDMILTTDECPVYIKKQKIHRLNWNGLWNSFSEWKKNFIMKIYDVSFEDLVMIKSKKIVLFTQTLYPDALSEEEHEKVIKQLLISIL